MGRVPLEPCTRVGSHTAPCPWVGSYRDPQTRVGPIQSPLHGSGPVWPHTDHRSYRDPRPQPCPTAALTHGWGPPRCPRAQPPGGALPPRPLVPPPPRPPRGFPPSVTPTHSRGGTPWGAGGGGPYTSTHGAPTRGNPTLSPIAPSQEPPRGQSGGVGVGNGEKVGRGALGGGSGTPSSHQGDAGASLPGWQQRGPQQGHGDPRGVPRAAVGPREPTAGGATQEPPWGRGGHDGDTGAVTGTREPRPPRTRPPPSCPAWPRFGSGPPAQPPRSPPHSCPTASCVSPSAPH